MVDVTIHHHQTVLSIRVFIRIRPTTRTTNDKKTKKQNTKTQKQTKQKYSKKKHKKTRTRTIKKQTKKEHKTGKH
jgi:hypothetical protein